MSPYIIYQTELTVARLIPGNSLNTPTLVSISK